MQCTTLTTLNLAEFPYTLYNAFRYYSQRIKGATTWQQIKPLNEKSGMLNTERRTKNRCGPIRKPIIGLIVKAGWQVQARGEKATWKLERTKNGHTAGSVDKNSGHKFFNCLGRNALDVDTTILGLCKLTTRMVVGLWTVVHINPLSPIIEVSLKSTGKATKSFALTAIVSSVLRKTNIENRRCSDSISNTAQFFDGNTERECLRGLYNAFAYAMVSMQGKAGFFSTPLFEQTPGSPCAFGLQFCPKSPVAVSNAFDGGSRVNVSRAINRKVDYPHVNAKPTIRAFFGRWFERVDSSSKVKLIVSHKQVRLALLRQKQAAGAFIGQVWQSYPTSNCIDGHFGAGLIPAQDATIISNGTVLAERALTILVQLISVRNLADNPNHNLSRQSKLIFHPIVQRLVKRVLTEGAVLPCPPTDIIGSVIGPFNRFVQRTCLFESRLKFDCNGQFHASITHYLSILDKWVECRSSSPQLKQGVFAATETR